MKKFILDSNVLMYDPKSLQIFEDNEVIIPIIVLDELDNAKSRPDEVGRNSRSVVRILDSLRKFGSLSDGVKLGNSTIRVELNHSNNIPNGLSGEKHDNRLISTAIGLKSEGRVIVVTKDINLRVKCDSLGIEAQDYIKDKVAENVDSIYSGLRELSVTSDVIDDLYTNGEVLVEDKGYVNQYFKLQSMTSLNHVALARFCEDGLLRPIKQVNDIFGINPRNIEQKLAMDALLDPDIKLVTLTGRAGSGKTLISVASALQQVISDKNRYNRILISRPIQPLGKDIGFLPGPQPLDAKILTPSGWTTMGDLKIGQNIISRDGSPTKVLKIFPKGTKSVYKVTTTDGSITECCEDHLWLTKTNNGGEKVRQTKEIMKDLEHGKLKYFLPRNEAVRFDKNNLPIPPYVLGALIGDGSFGKDSTRVAMYSADSEIIDKINKDLKELGCYANYKSNIGYTISTNKSLGGYNPIGVRISDINGVKEYVSLCEASRELQITDKAIRYRCKNNKTVDGKYYECMEKKISSNPVKNALHELKLFGKTAYYKFIPDIYKYSSIKDRLELLKGLMDTDGSVKKDGEASFCTTSKQLAYDVIELVKSLGGRAKLRRRNRETKLNKNIYSSSIYEFTISLFYNPFSLNRKVERFKQKRIIPNKIEKIEYVGEKPVQCILVDNPEHLYITDDYIVTHNTMEEKLQPWMQPIYDNLEFLLGSDNYMLNEYKNSGIIQIEPLTYIRGRSIPKSFMILDECQNITAKEVKTVITRMGENSKIILTGDIDQIDNPYVDFADNGLTHVVEIFKEYDISAHVTLKKGERSKLATLASKVL